MDGTRIEFAPGLNCIIGARVSWLAIQVGKLWAFCLSLFLRQRHWFASFLWSSPANAGLCRRRIEAAISSASVTALYRGKHKLLELWRGQFGEGFDCFLFGLSCSPLACLCRARHRQAKGEQGRSFCKKKFFTTQAMRAHPSACRPRARRWWPDNQQPLPCALPLEWRWLNRLPAQSE